MPLTGHCNPWVCPLWMPLSVLGVEDSSGKGFFFRMEKQVPAITSVTTLIKDDDDDDDDGGDSDGDGYGGRAGGF